MKIVNSVDESENQSYDNDDHFEIEEGGVPAVVTTPNRNQRKNGGDDDDDDGNEMEIEALQEFANDNKLFDPNTLYRESSSESSVPPPPPPSAPPVGAESMQEIECSFNGNGEDDMDGGRGGSPVFGGDTSKSHDKLRFQKVILQLVGAIACLLIVVSIGGVIVATRMGGREKDAALSGGNGGDGGTSSMGSQNGNADDGSFTDVNGEIPATAPDVSTLSPTSLTTTGSTVSGTTECGEVLTIKNNNNGESNGCFLQGGGANSLISLTVDYSQLCGNTVMPGDWLAIYPDGSDPLALDDEYVVWTWASCGADEANGIGNGNLNRCRQQTSVRLQIDNTIQTNEDGTTSTLVEEGDYRVYYIRADQPPYPASAYSNTFVIAETC